jgi:N-acetylmuramoyl-L-alanine amidase
MKRITSLLVLVFFVAVYAFSQRADLSGIKICIDPGHGGHSDATDRHVIPDPGTNYYESESNFQKALHLKALLEAKGATVILTRYTNDYPTDDEPSLAARVQTANSNNVNWFHSIHSNALGSVNNGTNYTLMLIREKIVAGGDPVYGPGTGKPETQGAWDISLIIGPNIKSKMRTTSLQQYLDWTFYGGSNGGYTLGVLRGLQMPGELSEGEFHDYYPVTRRLMNLSFCKMEAYAIRDAFLTYYGVPADSLSIVAGFISELGTGKLIDAVQVRLLPENVVYNGDLYHNGFYMFDGIKTGAHWVRFETPGYKADSVQINVGIGSTTFIDRQTESLAAPVIISSTPTNNDTSYSAAGQIQFVFSKVMDTASIRTNFSITPSVKGSLIWSSSNTVLTFKPDSVVLPFNTSYTIRIEGLARSQSGLLLDGNGDGTPGDAFQVKFKTRPVDVWPPVIVASSPSSTSPTVASNSVINFTFDEPLDPSSVNSTNIVVQEVGTGNRQLTFSYDTRSGRGGVNIFPQGGLAAGKSYKVRLSGVKDAIGNPIPTTSPLYTFSVGPQSYQYTVIEDFGTSIASWAQPGFSGSTIGIDSGAFTRDTLVTLSILSSSSRSARLSYVWNTTTATDWLIREYLNGGTPRSITWNKRGSRLQAYVYGDGSGTLFRFAVDDSVDVFPAGTTQNHEVNQWLPIDWVGWRLVEWDLENDSLGTWLGNGKLEGMLRFDSFQLKYPQGSKIKSGAIYVAQLQVAKNTATAVEPVSGVIPIAFELLQNYPNPFNPTTSIGFRISNYGLVTLKIFDVLGREIVTLVNEARPAGEYTLRWDASSLPSGVYFYQLRAGDFVQTKKLVLAK